MIETILQWVLYLSAFFLAVVCVYTAHNMTTNTCVCIKRCFYLIVGGLVGLVMAVFYDFNKWLSMLSMLPIVWGVTGWLLFDRYRAHESIGRIYDDIMDIWYELRYRVRGFVDKARKAVNS